MKQRDRILADDYDRTVNELFFETKKAKAADRMKTEEEKAQEEKQLLEKLEVCFIRSRVIFSKNHYAPFHRYCKT